MMPVTFVVKSKLFWLVCISICLVVLLVATTQAPDISPVTSEERDSAWKTAAFRYSSADAKKIERLMTGTLWGAEQEQETEVQDVAWSLKGIVVENGTFEAIVDLDSESKQVTPERFGRFAEGDSLPNGATLVLIAKDYVEYELNGVTNRKRLYE